MTIDENYIEKLINDAVKTVVETDVNMYQFGYNKAIDDFAEKLKVKAEEIMKNPDISAECKKCAIWKVSDIDTIAEQMKTEKE